MQINRGLVFWGVALITAGLVALAIQSDVIAADAARQAWRLWPIVLVVIGVSVIAARTPFGAAAVLLAGIVAGGLAGTLVAGAPDGLSIGCGGEPTEAVTADGAFSDSAEVLLDLHCGNLDVSTRPGASWTVEARHGADEEPEVTSTADSLEVRADGASFIGFGEDRQAWDVVLPTDVRLSLAVDVNAASSSLDLADADLSSLTVDGNAGSVTLNLSGADARELIIDANAGSVSITTDEATRFGGSMDLNAGSLELCTSPTSSLAITLEDPNPTFSHNLDDRGLHRSGDKWTRGSGEPDIRLTMDANAASFTLDPEDGCR